MTSLSQVELYLLHHSCGLAVEPVEPSGGDDASTAACNIASGRYVEAVSSVPALRSLLDARDLTGAQAPTDPASYYALVAGRASAAVQATVQEEDRTAAPEGAVQAEHVLLAGVACLHVFVQHNLTGPSAGPAPPTPLDLFAPTDVSRRFAAPPPRPPPAAIASVIAAALAGADADAPASATPAAAGAAPPSASAGAEAAGGQEGGEQGGEAGAARADGLGGLGLETSSRADTWAREQLQVDGEDLAGRLPALQWLFLARTLLLAPLRLGAAPPKGHSSASSGAPASEAASSDAGAGAAGAATGVVLGRARLPQSWAWWGLRTVLTQQHALEGRSASLLHEAGQLIQALIGPGAPWASSAPEAAAGPAPVRALAGVLHVELALAQYAYGMVDGGRQYLGRAGELLGLQPQLTGALGKRTVHQIDAKAQLVVAAPEEARAAPPAAPGAGGQGPDLPVEDLGLSGSASPSNPELVGLQPEADVLPAPQLVGEGGERIEARYSSPEQALLLGWATEVKKATSADELQEWEMAPWVEAVLAQGRSRFMTRAAAQLLKVRHERTRGRTRERALLSMDLLADAVVGGGLLEGATKEEGPAKEDGQEAAAARLQAAAGQRSALAWAVWFPLQVSLKREAAEHYVSMGLVGAALRVFEALEAWDAAITCYRLAGKRQLAEELVRRRLEQSPDDPRLWCALGDLYLNDRFYEEAWRRSGQRHTRSQRSLARSAMRRKDYPKASRHWDLALALNPLQPEAWFSLGFCLLKEERHRDALRAFTRVTQQEPDNGQAWNNIAALWLHLGGYSPAFAALSEAVRYSRDSWQMWENYARAALASGHYPQAVRGLQMTLQLSGGQRLFVEVAQGLLDVLEGRPPPRDGGTDPRAAAAAAAEGLMPGAGAAGAAEAEDDTLLKEEEAALGAPLLPLLSDVPLRPLGADEPDDPSTPAADDGATTSGTPAPSSSSDPQPPQQQGQQGQGQQGQGQELLSGRTRENVLAGVGAVLREGVNGPAAGPALWGCLARYWALRGEMESAKEARIKQVRALAGGAFKTDEARFVEYAQASEALCRAYIQCYQAGKPGGSKDLSAGRMHLKGMLRATQEAFGEHPETAKLQAVLEEVTALEDQALAEARAARG
ncbi:hypothetical protein HYH03_006983 [Edaphochlamys debaryana]|uniref:Uncharacterized protein n=1 Tax=Edaphochlamys debaryana TaxID=47281 RepID=A0A835Y5E8_9CHLO|nr:hypothetical protein HYH03_006983 [Edaphochlamys debaryana]|eukprot:KAG2495053.1 hypothetical protein HYH03_006983 [Edaphochlamys debaryana]